MPVDADIKSEAYVSAEAVDVDSVLAQMQDAKTRVNVVDGDEVTLEKTGAGGGSRTRDLLITNQLLCL